MSKGLSGAVAATDEMKTLALRVATRIATGLGVCYGMFALSIEAQAQAYPTKPIRLIVPFAGGGSADIQARMFAREMQTQLGQSIIVDNRAGATSVLGTELVASALPDGYTVLFTTTALATSTALFAGRMKIDPVKDLAPVSWITSTPLVLAVHPGVLAKSARELIEIAKRRPTVFNAAINFAGSTSHLAAEQLKQLGNLKFATVAYKSEAFAMLAVISGEVDFQFAQAVLAARQAKAGRARALAVTSAEPSEFFPGLPTMRSLLPGFTAEEWFALYVPAGTRQETIMVLNGALRNALETKLMRAYLADEHLTAVCSSPAGLDAFLKRQIAHYSDIARKREQTAE